MTTPVPLESGYAALQRAEWEAARAYARLLSGRRHLPAPTATPISRHSRSPMWALGAVGAGELVEGLTCVDEAMSIATGGEVRVHASLQAYGTETLGPPPSR